MRARKTEEPGELGLLSHDELIEDPLTQERDARLVAERTVKLLARLQTINVALASALKASDIAEAIVSAGMDALGAAGGVLATLDADARELILMETRGYRDDVREQWSRFSLDDSLPLSDAVRERRLVILTNGEERDRMYPSLAGKAGDRALMSAPITLGDTAIGGLNFSFADARTFEEDEIAFMRALSELTALAMERGRLYEAERAERERAQSAEQRLERLYGEALATDSNLRLHKAVLEWQNESTLDGVLVVDDRRRVISVNQRYVEMWELSSEVLADATHSKLLAHKLGKVRDPEAYVARIEELYSHPDAEGRDEVELVDGRVLDRWSAPLRDEAGDLRGRAWYYRDVTMRRLAEREMRARQRRAELLAEATTALTSSMDERVMLGEVANVAIRSFADWCVIDTAGEWDEIERVATAGRDPKLVAMMTELDPVRSAPADLRSGLGARGVIVSGRTEVHEKIQDEWLVKEAHGDETFLKALRAVDPQAYVCVPMKMRGRTVGALTFVRCGDAEPFSPTDVALSEELAYRIASAIEHARLYRESRYIATTLQRSLLPPVIPELPRAEVAARYHPATEGTLVGGDFYDIFETGRGDWAIVLGDVCGKGADAAATTAMARHSIRTAAMQARRPSRVLGTLNEAMVRAESRFCTVAYARLRIDETRFRVTVACGGHPLPLVLKADGTIHEAGANGMLLGAFETPVLVDRTIDLSPGDALIFYTDGVIEARANGEIMGEERLYPIIQSCRGRSAGEIAAALETAALEFQSGRARDDIAIVVLTVR